jgi:O-antigen ligase
LTPFHLLGGLLCLLLAAPFVPDSTSERLFNPSRYTLGGSETLQTRLSYWSSGISMLKDNWLFGMGIGNFSELPKVNDKASEGFGFMHNIYLQMLNEVGIVGFAFLLAFLITTWRAFRKAEKAYAECGDADMARLCAALQASFLSVLVIGFTMDILHFAIKDWWLVAALAVPLREIALARPRLGHREERLAA